MSNIRLHIPAIPYTITRSEFSHDAYTGKVQRFSPMMRSRGFEVYHYGVETSESGATKQIDIMTKKEWTNLRIKTWQFLDASLNWEQATQRNNDPTIIISTLSNWSSPLAVEFNKRFRKALQKNYRSCQTDIVCLPLGQTHLAAIKDLDIVSCETGIGYGTSFSNYRIFESHTWMSHTLAKEDKNPQNYWFVVPNYYDIQEFTLSLVPKNPIRIGFMGRISDFKGCRVITEIASRFPNIEFIICGQGNPEPYLKSPNMRYMQPLHGSQRSDFLGSCTAFLHLPTYDEPFGGAAVEAQLCGTPVISTDWGAMTQTIEQFKTGLRGHTLADFCKGVQMAIDGKFDRQYIRDRAAMLYDMYAVAPQFEYVFKSILDVHTPGKNGWYSPDCHMMQLVPAPTKEAPPTTKEALPTKKKEPRIYIIIPYYGAFPNYFQLFLDSVGINTDILTLILITDIDLSSYRCPSNLVVISMTKEAVQIRAATFIRDTYGKSVEPNELLLSNYKFVDFKIVYPKLFDDILKEQGATEIDYVGWGDCDLIYGKLSNFIKFEENYGILGGWHGHFVAIQNTDSFKNSFKRIPNYLDLITDNSQTYITDEIAYREPLIAYINENNIKMYFANRDFCDIVPPCFYHMSRPDWASWKKNFYDLYNPTKNIRYLYYNNLTLRVVYDDGSQREALYGHLQKRKMELPSQDYTDGYYITEHAFAKELITESPATPEKPAQHYTVITYCSGYDYKIFKTFTSSLFDTGFQGNLIFVIQQADIDKIEKLKTNYSRVSYYVDDVVNSRHCQQKRYYIYQNLFKTLSTDYVLICDSRDILFQRNIEEYRIDPNVDVFFFEEGRNIGQCWINQKWLHAIEEELTMNVISVIKDKPILCSGTTFGKCEGVKQYVDAMCDLMTNTIHTEFTEFTGFDQGIHNFLVYMKGLPHICVGMLTNEDNLVNNLQYNPHKFMNANSELVNRDNEVSYVVHQWDRLPDYMTSRLANKYGF